MSLNKPMVLVMLNTVTKGHLRCVSSYLKIFCSEIQPLHYTVDLSSAMLSLVSWV